MFGSAQGSLAERVVAKPELVLPLPDTLSFDQGAGMFPIHLRHKRLADKQGCTGLYVTYPTSYEALVGRANLQPG